VERTEDLSGFWPLNPRRNGKIIVTTRHPEIGYSLTEDAIIVLPFTPVEGRKCILSLATWPGGVPPDPAAAEELSNELGGLALGIVHMTALMRARKTPIRKFLSDYRRNPVKYHNTPAVKTLSIYPEIKPEIASNWIMAFNALNEGAKSLLGVLSFLSSDLIPRDLFNNWDGSYGSRITVGLPTCCDNSEEYVL
jgi:hypothetical protein